MWRVHKPEFAAGLNPCATHSTWRRNVVTVKDAGKQLEVSKNGDWWELSIDGHLRSMTQSLEFEDSAMAFSAGVYDICSSADALRRGQVRVKSENTGRRATCHVVKPESLLVNFPEGFVPTHVVSGSVAPLANTMHWSKTSESLPQYVKVTDTNQARCAGVPQNYSGLGTPVFFLTRANEWLIHDPRIVMKDNTLDSPLANGGLNQLSAKEIRFCSNVPRTMFNEESCVLFRGQACRPGTTNPRLAKKGLVVCGSAGEVANDPLLGDNWLDVSAVDLGRQRDFGIPLDTESGRRGQEREFIWSQVVATAPDQLRQRTAWALSQIFSMPKSSIITQNRLNEFFQSYYDIFVRNSFGNYRDVLMETTFHPLMAESLSFLFSRSVGSAFAEDKLLL